VAIYDLEFRNYNVIEKQLGQVIDKREAISKNNK
jgi:hypothetical protein